MSVYDACVYLSVIALALKLSLKCSHFFLFIFRKKIQIWTNCITIRVNELSYTYLCEEKLHKSMYITFETKSHLVQINLELTVAQASPTLWHSFQSVEIVGIQNYTQL